MSSANPSRTEQNLWTAIIEEAVAQMKYIAFAERALEDGLPEIAELFRETAGAENVHGLRQLQAAGEVKSTIENLRDVVANEARELESLYPRLIEEVRGEQREDAVEALSLAMEGGQIHLDRFYQALHQLEREGAPSETGNEAAPGVSATRVESGAGSGPAVQLKAPPLPGFQPRQAIREVGEEGGRVAALRRIREIVFGSQDGLISTFAVITAISAAVTENSTIVVAGLASALAGMISMATGTYLGSKSERQILEAEIGKEARELEEKPEEEMAELIFLYHQRGMSYPEAKEMAERIASDKDLWLRTLVEKELGINPDLLTNPIKDGLVMGAAFIAAAMIPIVPFLIAEGNAAIAASASCALVGLFSLGALKGWLVQRSPLRQGIEVFVIGAAAGALGLLLGEGLPRLV